MAGGGRTARSRATRQTISGRDPAPRPPPSDRPAAAPVAPGQVADRARACSPAAGRSIRTPTVTRRTRSRVRRVRRPSAPSDRLAARTSAACAAGAGAAPAPPPRQPPRTGRSSRPVGRAGTTGVPLPTRQFRHRHRRIQAAPCSAGTWMPIHDNRYRPLTAHARASVRASAPSRRTATPGPGPGSGSSPFTSARPGVRCGSPMSERGAAVEAAPRPRHIITLSRHVTSRHVTACGRGRRVRR